MQLTRQELEACYAEWETPLYNFALRWTWNPALAQELVQEAFIRVWQRRDRIERSTLKAFLYKIVQNLAIAERRRERLARKFPIFSLLTLSVDDSPGDLEKDYGDRQQWQSLRAAIESLPEDLRQTLLLCEFSDLSYHEVGEILGIPPGTVASRKSRAMQLLRELASDGK